MSNVRIEDTAMSSELDDEVTAMKRVIRRAIAPFLPRRAAAPNGAERPDEI